MNTEHCIDLHPAGPTGPRFPEYSREAIPQRPRLEAAIAARQAVVIRVDLGRYSDALGYGCNGCDDPCVPTPANVVQQAAARELLATAIRRAILSELDRINRCLDECGDVAACARHARWYLTQDDALGEIPAPLISPFGTRVGSRAERHEYGEMVTLAGLSERDQALLEGRLFTPQCRPVDTSAEADEAWAAVLDFETEKAGGRPRRRW